MKNYEAPIEPENHFRLSNGRVLKNLYELVRILKNIDEETFKFHVKDNKNDFGNWIRDVFKDKKLAKSIFDAKTKEGMVRAIDKALFKLNKNVKYKGDRKKNAASIKENLRLLMQKEKRILEHVKKNIGLEKALNKKQLGINKKLLVLKEKEKSIQDYKKKISVKSEELRIKEADLARKESNIIHLKRDNEKLLEAISLAKKEKKDYLSEIKEEQKHRGFKINEILLKEKEIEKREEKIEHIEEKIEKELGELAARKEPKFFSKEFIHGILIGLLSALIIGVVYIKFFS